MAEAPDALDPISALREQRRTALRKAQAKVGQASGGCQSLIYSPL